MEGCKDNNKMKGLNGLSYDEDTDEVEIEIKPTDYERFQSHVKVYVYKYGKDKQVCFTCNIEFVPVIDGGCLTMFGWKCHKCLWSLCI